MIELEQLCKRFSQKNAKPVIAVDHINLSVPQGEICVLLGPSGCGKTTTLKLVNRLINPDSGYIRIHGEDTSTIDVVSLRRNIGYVIQQIGLFPGMTIEQNITLVPRMLGWSRARCQARAAELMQMVALDSSLLKRYPKHLSGGEQQRVGVIRALAADPPVLLMDEPFGAVDPVNREAIQNQFLDMQRQLRKTVLLVSHDIDEALKLGDLIAVFSAGKIVQCARPDQLLAQPAGDFVRSFVGEERSLKRLLLVKAADMVLNSDPVTVKQNTTLTQAATIMHNQRRDVITVLNSSGKPVGCITDSCASNGRGYCAEYLQPLPDCGSTTDNLRIILAKLCQHNSSAIVIVDEQGCYRGEITLHDIVSYLRAGRVA